MPVRPVFLLLTFLVLGALGSAAGAGATFRYDGAFIGPSAYGAESSQGWNVFLNQGDTLRVTLEWFDPTADLDAFVIAPAGSCSITDTACLASLNRVSCPNIPRGGPLGDLDGVESWAWTAPARGWHELFVGGAIVGPITVPYYLVVDIDGDASTSDISSGRTVTFLPNQCRALESAPKL